MLDSSQRSIQEFPIDKVKVVAGAVAMSIVTTVESCIPSIVAPRYRFAETHIDPGSCDT